MLSEVIVIKYLYPAVTSIYIIAQHCSLTMGPWLPLLGNNDSDHAGFQPPRRIVTVMDWSRNSSSLKVEREEHLTTTKVL
jgi:hypothetical protein